jgi:hypothetical protein
MGRHAAGEAQPLPPPWPPRIPVPVPDPPAPIRPEPTIIPVPQPPVPQRDREDHTPALIISGMLCITGIAIAMVMAGAAETFGEMVCAAIVGWAVVVYNRHKNRKKGKKKC